METMDGPSLFESMYSDDAEGQRMKEMPGVDELMMIYPLKTIALNKLIMLYSNSQFLSN